MHTFWLSYPFQWDTSTDVSTFVRNHFKSSIYNLYFLFRKFQITFSVGFLCAAVLYFGITIIRWQNSIRNSIILLKWSAHIYLYAMVKPSICLGYLGLSFFVHDRPFKPTTDCRLSLLGAWKQKFYRNWRWHFVSAYVLECNRAPASVCVCVYVIRVFGLAILINCFSAPGEDLSWFTLILSFGGSIVAGTVLVILFHLVFRL